MPKRKPPTATPDQIAVYAHLFMARRRAEASEKKRTAALKKEMSNAGVVAADIEGAIKEAMETTQDRLAKAERRAVYLQAVGARVQLELFESSKPRRNDPLAIARQRGRMDAILGRTEMDIGFPAGSPEGQAWLEGHRELMDMVAAYGRRFETQDDEAPPTDGDIVVHGYDSDFVIPKDEVRAL